MQYFKKHSLSIWVFSLCAILVFFIQFRLYQSVIQYSLFIPEDWSFIVYYHSLDLNFWEKLVHVWRTSGLHVSAEIFYGGILSNFLGYNYQAYQIVNVVLKAIGTISFFPLVLVLFKSVKLAFLATLLFGMSSATGGSFLWIVKGSEYIGIALLNIFLITYYFVILKNSKKLLVLSSALFLLAYLMAPPRMYPQLLLIPAVELYWLLKTRRIKNLVTSVLRLIVYILPVVLISLPAPVSPGYPFASRGLILLKDIINGNWQNLLDPFAGIGWTILTNDYWRFFGTLEVETFKSFTSYLTFLFERPIFIFGILSLVLAAILSKRFGRIFLLISGLNLIAEIIMFFIAGYPSDVADNLILADSPDHFVFTKYPTLIAIYIFIVAFVSLLEWRKDKQNNLLKAIWVGPIFSVIFLWPTWMLLGPLINDWVSVHWYFGIPAMGTTLFLAAILVLLYEKLKMQKFLRILAILIIFTVVYIFYQSHGNAITKQFMGINPEKVSLKDQQKLHEELINRLGDSAKVGDVLVFLDIAEDNINSGRTQNFYKRALVIQDLAFGEWMHFRRGEKTSGCIDAILDKEALKSIIREESGETGFIFKGKCIYRDPVSGETIDTGKKDNFYKTDNFYAFRLQNGEFINIKEEVLKDLGLYNYY